jgi:hypothetical protein
VGALSLGNLCLYCERGRPMDSRPYHALHKSPLSRSYARLVDVALDFMARHWKLCRWCWCIPFAATSMLFVSWMMQQAPAPVDAVAAIVQVLTH